MQHAEQCFSTSPFLKLHEVSAHPNAGGKKIKNKNTLQQAAAIHMRTCDQALNIARWHNREGSRTYVNTRNQSLAI